jgi:hypothetical protein
MISRVNYLVNAFLLFPPTAMLWILFAVMYSTMALDTSADSRTTSETCTWQSGFVVHINRSVLQLTSQYGLHFHYYPIPIAESTRGCKDLFHLNLHRALRRLCHGREPICAPFQCEKKTSVRAQLLLLRQGKGRAGRQR